MRKVPKLIFDTSGFNALRNDPDRQAVTAGICLSYHVGITVTAFSEIIATSEEAERKELVAVLQRLLACGQCVMHFSWIIEKHAKVYLADPTAYEWRPVIVRWLAAEREIAVQEFMHNLSEETKQENRRAEKEFKGFFKKVRPKFDEIFASGKERPSLENVAKVLVAPGGAYFVIAADLFERAAGKRPSDDEIKDFVERCPPFKALIMALCYSQYNICIRGENIESLGDAGRVDVYSAVFVPYCKVFVTNDDGQYKALKVIADLTGVETTILMYSEFKQSLGLIG